MQFCELSEVLAMATRLVDIKKAYSKELASYKQCTDLLPNYQIAHYGNVIGYKSNLIGIPGDVRILYTIGVGSLLMPSNIYAMQCIGNTSQKYILCERCDDSGVEKPMYAVGIIGGTPTAYEAAYYINNAGVEDKLLPFVEYEKMVMRLAPIIYDIDAVRTALTDGIIDKHNC